MTGAANCIINGGTNMVLVIGLLIVLQSNSMSLFWGALTIVKIHRRKSINVGINDLTQYHLYFHILGTSWYVAVLRIGVCIQRNEACSHLQIFGHISITALQSCVYGIILVWQNKLPWHLLNHTVYFTTNKFKLILLFRTWNLPWIKIEIRKQLIMLNVSIIGLSEYIFFQP